MIEAIKKPSTPVLQPANFARELSTRLWIGLMVICGLVFGLGGWAAITNISGAIIAPGTIVVDGDVKKVQHPTGGVVGEILVKNGDKVRAGDVLVRLDETQTRAALGVVVSQLIELTGRATRLRAERDNLDKMTLPEDFKRLSTNAESIGLGEARLFAAKRTLAEGQKSQLREQIAQLRQEIEGLMSQREAKARELTLIHDELARITDLYARELIPVTRLLNVQRDETRIDGEHGALSAQISRTSGQISETEIKILSIDQTRQSEAQTELRETEAKISELTERRIAAEDQLRRVELRAPLSGFVHQLLIHTEGGVIGPGESVMLIVPDEAALSIEIRIPPADIDQVSPGQTAVLRFPAFNQQTTPELTGTVQRIGADLTKEPETGLTFFVARVKIDEAEKAKLGTRTLVPGMPVEVFVETGQRTALSYLGKPLTDQFSRIFKETR